MKMRQLWVSVLVWVALCLTIGVTQAQEKSYSAGRFDVDVTVNEGGDVLVTETVVFDFVGGPFTYVFRELPTDHTDGLEIVSASVDGVAYGRGEATGQVEIGRGDPLRITWHMPPTSDATHTFELTYRAYGVVRQEAGADLLRWQALPDEYEYAIARSTTVVRYPAGLELLGEPAVMAGTAVITPQPGQVSFTTDNLDPNSPLVVALRFPAGSLIGAPPAWQASEQAAAAQREAANAWWPFWLAGAAVLLVGGLAAFIAWSRRYTRRTVLPAGPQYTPPGSLKPGLTAALVNGAEGPTWANALGTMFDLAARGALRIEELPEKHWYRQHNFELQLVKRPSGLRPHEDGLLDMLFTSKKGSVDRIKLSDLGNVMTSAQWKKYKEPLEAELKVAGFFSESRKRARTGFLVVGMILLLTGGALLLLTGILMDSFGFGPLLPAFSMAILGLVGMVMGAVLSPLSDEGAATAVAWKAFAQHLKDVSRGKAAVGSPDMFETYLPYAAGFGLLHEWAKHFEKAGWNKLPPYFHVLATTDDASYMAAFVAMSAATASSGGSAAGAAGAAGAGAAGGGASGAG